MSGIHTGEPIFLSAHYDIQVVLLHCYDPPNCIENGSPKHEVAKCFIVNHTENAM